MRTITVKRPLLPRFWEASLFPTLRLILSLGLSAWVYAIEDVPEGQTYLIQGSSAVGNRNIQTGGFEVFGTLRLESANATWTSALTVTNGVLTNATMGVIEVNPGSGGARAITGDVLNRGTFSANYGLNLSTANGLFANQGTFNIAQDQTVTIAGAGQAFDQSGGALNINGALRLQGIRFNYNGGIITGTPPYLINCTLSLGAEAKNSATFIQTGGNSVLLGDLWAEQTV